MRSPMLVLTAAGIAACAACKSHPEKSAETQPRHTMQTNTHPSSVVGAVPAPQYYWDGAIHPEPHPLGCDDHAWHDHVHTLSCGHVYKDGHWWKTGARADIPAETVARE